MTRVVLAGATGWAGSALARAIAGQVDLALVAAVARRAAGRPLGEAIGAPGLETPVFATASEALAAGCDVFVEYTKPDTAKANILAALDAGLKERVLPWLRRVRDEWDVPCLHVTHSVGEALSVAGHALVLRAGRVVAAGDPRALLGAPALEEETREGIENLLTARVEAHDEEGGITYARTADGLDVAVTLAAARPVGSAVTLAIRAEDVLVASGPLPGLSARNACAGRVLAIERTGTDVLLRCSLDAGGELLARITPAALLALGLGVGRAVVLAVKSHSIRLL